MADWNFDYGAIAQLVDHPKVQADLDRRTDAAETAARAVCPTDSRKLIGTIRTERLGHGRRVLYGNESDAWYAPIVEWGTPRHIIRPRKGRFLRWVDPGTGQFVFARQVDHPGTPAYRVMSGAALEAAAQRAR